MIIDEINKYMSYILHIINVTIFNTFLSIHNIKCSLIVLSLNMSKIVEMLLFCFSKSYQNSVKYKPYPRDTNDAPGRFGNEGGGLGT